MFIPKFFTLKTGLLALALLTVLWLLPDSLTSAESFFRDSPSTEIAATTTTAKPAPVKTLPPKSGTGSPSTNTGNDLPDILKPDPKLQRPSLVTQSVLLALMALLPFIMMLLTSFLKIVVVLSLLRTALGVQQAPPNAVINGVAFMLSIFIMFPTGVKMYEAGQRVKDVEVPESILSPDSSTYVIAFTKAAAEPLREFLKRNSSPKHHALFFRLVYRNLNEEYRETLKPDNFLVLVPSYITSQLKDAFEIGVLIYLPFFVIDLVTSNVLLAMGMMMLSPVTISMPLKLFLLVMLDGWTILIEGLVRTFQ